MKLFLGFFVFIILLFSIFVFLFGSKSSPFYAGQKDLGSVSNLTFECQENWICTEWSVCIKGLQRRACDEINDCGTSKDKKSLSRECDFNLNNIVTSSENDESFDALGNLDSIEDYLGSGVSQGFDLDSSFCENTLPDCGVSDTGLYPSIEFEGEEFNNYEADCALVCMGKNLLSTCEQAELTLEDESGNQILKTLGVQDSKCLVEWTYVEEDLNMICPIPVSIMESLISCFNGNCLEEGLPGHTSYNILLAMFYSASTEGDTNCEGSLVEYFKNL